MKTKYLCGSLVLSCWLVTGCGDSDPGSSEPRLIETGGVADGAIDGLVHVHVIDEVTGAPLEAAVVTISELDSGPNDSVTDANGLATFRDDGLAGPATFTVEANGYVSSTWYGANGTNITIPVAPAQYVPPTARLSGTLDTSSLVPLQSQDLVLVAFYPSLEVLTSTQPDLPEQTQTSTCLVGGLTCSWEIVSRAGTVAVVAAAFNVDINGTPADSSDDVITLLDIGVLSDVVVEEGVDQTGLVVEMLGTVSTSEVSVDTPPLPPGLSEITAVVLVDHGDNGLLVFGSLEPSELLVPTPSGVFASSSYRGFASASNDDGEETTVVVNDVSDLQEGVTFPEWMALPSDLVVANREVSFVSPPEASVHGGRIEGTWNFNILDNRSSFTVPDQIDIGNSFSVAVDAIEVPGLDVGDFVLGDVFGQATRISSADSD